MNDLPDLPRTLVKRLLIATGNAGKVREFREMLNVDAGGLDFLDLTVLPVPLPEVEETGLTFRENACLKATFYARHAASVGLTDIWALADDSGLAVDALGGRPGVTSARWAQLHQAGSGDADNNALLLKQLEATRDEKRTARFVCVLALADPIGRIVLTTQDSVEGRILREGRGNNGFGYDPLFLIDAFGQTTAELSPQRKHEISHRGKALRALRTLMLMTGVMRN